MNTDFADALSKALEEKSNDVNSFIWKGPRDENRTQVELKLMDATPEQLKEFKEHCTSMLYNKSKDHPGRYELINIIREQEDKCTAELYMRYLRKNKIMPIDFRKTIVDFLNKEEVKESIPRSSYKTTPIGSIVKVPDEFYHISIDMILDACLSSLGIFQRNSITHTFIYKLGLWFTNNEIKEYLSKKDDKGNVMDKLDQVKFNLNLPQAVRLHVNRTSGLSYLEFRAMHNLRNDRYENISETALLTLKNKVLPRLEDEAREQAAFWEQKIKEIDMVCEAKGFGNN